MGMKTWTSGKIWAVRHIQKVKSKKWIVRFLSWLRPSMRWQGHGCKWRVPLWCTGCKSWAHLSCFYHYFPKIEMIEMGTFYIGFCKGPHATPNFTIYWFNKQLFVGHTGKEPAYHHDQSLVFLNCLNLLSFKSCCFHCVFHSEPTGLQL